MRNYEVMFVVKPTLEEGAVKALVENMKKVLPNQYTYYGKFRFFKNIVTKYLYPFSKFNESVPIITNLKVLSKNEFFKKN